MIKNKVKWGAVALASAFLLGTAPVIANGSSKTDDAGSKVTYKIDGKTIKDQWFYKWGNNYYFNADGYRLTNKTAKIDGTVYHFNDDGVMVKDGFSDGGDHYYNQEGEQVADYFYSNWGHTYYYGADGKRYTDQFYSNWGNTYYFGSDGALYQDRFYSNWGNTYYFKPDGVLARNYVYTNWGHSYYFDQDGVLAKNRDVTINGASYHADTDGVLQGGIQSGDYGVDVSSFQGTDLSGYAASGAKYAIVKVSEGTGYVNYNASGQIASAQANNMYTMAYHFATFSNDSYAAVNQANFAIQQAQAAGLPAGSYLCLDWETGDGNYIYGNTEANTQAILAFMRTVQAAGYKTMLYSGASALRNNVNMSEVLAEFPNSLWVASYPTTAAQWQANMNYFPSMDGVAVWQFADNWAGFGVDGNIAVANVN